MWNSLQFEIQGAKIIDLFSGSGAIGLEALSRGAGYCLFVEQSEAAIRCLRSNIAAAQKRAQGDQRRMEQSLRKGDALQVVLGLEAEQWDLIWIDPPYEEVPKWGGQLEAASLRLLKPSGKLIFECDEQGLDIINKIREHSHWVEKKHKRYGKTYITILQKMET